MGQGYGLFTCSQGNRMLRAWKGLVVIEIYLITAQDLQGKQHINLLIV